MERKVKQPKRRPKTYNTRYSLVVTDPTTNPALTGLSMGERTGSRVFQWVWSYVMTRRCIFTYIAKKKNVGRCDVVGQRCRRT
ncbi:hypothetical protein CTRU02_207640 [Colletotrichum truncatum]|uniref:Uncharacterized protein n=1 Tax=Colletotrichum truncatum TaxID=5467 RepID=A0ACC3Z1E3_COLTU